MQYPEFVIPGFPELRLRVYDFGCKSYDERLDAGYCALLDGDPVPCFALNEHQRKAFDDFLFNVFPE